MSGCFMRRKACIQFINKNTISVNTNYRNREIHLQNEMIIDLVNLRTSEDPKVSLLFNPIFAAVVEGDEEQDDFSLRISVYTDKDKTQEEQLGTLSLKDRTAVYFANVWDE